MLSGFDTSSNRVMSPGPQAEAISVAVITSDYLRATRRLVEEACLAAPEESRAQFVEVSARIDAFAAAAKQAGMAVTGSLSAALSMLARRLCQNGRLVTPSTINTVTRALIFLEDLCAPGTEEQLACFPPIHVLVIDDDPLAKRAVTGTLERDFQKPETASDGATGLEKVLTSRFDVIFTDVEMPVLTGFELCAKAREAGPNKATPIVFISSLNDPAIHAEGYRAGGNDFITKPFLPIEMTVKALTIAWSGRLSDF
jgi:CheY-like chemotaxis protein